MSVSGLFSIGTSALQAAYSQLQTTGHNIANVDTPGYTRQRTELATTTPMFTGGGFVGRGVEVVTVARLYDRFLVAQVQAGTASAAGDAARMDLLAELEALVGAQSGGIGMAVDDFRLALGDLVNRPGDIGARTVVLGRAQALAERFRSLSAGIAQIGEAVEARMAAGVERLNESLRDLAAVNDAIARASGTGQPPNDLLDRRDALVSGISGLLQVTSRENPDGTVSLFGAGGHGLVVGGAVAQLGLQADPLDPASSRLVLRTPGSDIPLSSALMGGGELAGMLRFRDQDLVSARDALGQLAAALASAYNTQHAAGVDLLGAPGGDLFQAGAPVVGQAAGNAGDAAFAVSVLNGAALAASDYTLDFDGSQYTVTRRSDGQVSVFGTPPVEIDGLRIELSSGAPVAGDRFLLRSASVMASGFSVVLSSAQRIAAGSAVDPTADPGMDNRNARALVGLGDLGLVQGRSFTDAWANILADVGQRSATAQGAAALSAAMLGDARDRLASVSGVNLDEEAARLLQYQQSYQAAAKVIAAAQSVFDTLLEIAR